MRRDEYPEFRWLDRSVHKEAISKLRIRLMFSVSSRHQIVLGGEGVILTFFFVMAK
jgi:hypothetical protein